MEEKNNYSEDYLGINFRSPYVIIHCLFDSIQWLKLFAEHFSHTLQPPNHLEVLSSNPSKIKRFFVTPRLLFNPQIQKGSRSRLP
jgi:hypothetical protein